MRRAALVMIAVAAAFAAAVAVLRRGRTAPVEPAAERVVSERPLDSMTRDELYKLASELDIPGRSRMKKTELRDALSRAGRSG